MEMQRTQINQNNLDKKLQRGRLTLPEFKISFKAVIVRTVVQWY